MARKSKAKSIAKAAMQMPEAPLRHALDVATLSRALETKFDLQPDKAKLARIAAFLQIEQLKAFRFRGELLPRRKDDWLLKARLTADLQQACVVTLAPVDEWIDEDVLLELLPLTKSTDKDTLDVLPDADDGPDYFQDQIDLGAIALERVALALEPYPRAADADFESDQFAAPGVQPLRDEDLKPFASLAALKENLGNKES